MEDISHVPTLDISALTAQLIAHPLDEQALKSKVDKIQSMTYYNEQDHVQDVTAVYAWIFMANHHLSLEQMLANDKAIKVFCEEFLQGCAKNLILCKRFTLTSTMATTQQFLL